MTDLEEMVDTESNGYCERLSFLIKCNIWLTTLVETDVYRELKNILFMAFIGKYQ